MSIEEQLWDRLLDLQAHVKVLLDEAAMHRNKHLPGYYRLNVDTLTALEAALERSEVPIERVAGVGVRSEEGHVPHHKTEGVIPT